MPDINITNRKVYSQYHNGTNYTLNLTDSMSHLYGCVMNKVKVVHTIIVGWKSEATQYTTFNYDAILFRITRASGSFLVDGFCVGDTFTATAQSNPIATIYTFTGTITAITDYEIFYTLNTGTAPTTNNYETFHIIGTTNIQALQISFGLIENTENVNYNSKVDTNEQVFYANGITGVFTNMTPLGTARSWVNGTARVRKLANIGTYQQFEIENEFIIVPYYLDGELSNLQTETEPLLWSGTRSLRYVTKYEFRNVLADPNTSKILKDNTLLGSTGWFNENYNGFNNIYDIQNVIYSGSDGFVPGTATEVQGDIICTDASNPFDVNSKVGLYFSYLPTQSEYENNTNTYSQNWLYDNIVNGLGVFAGAGIIQSYEFTLINPNTIHFKAILNVPSANLDNTDYYVLGIETARTGTLNSNTDRVMLLADVRNFDASSDIPNLYDLEYLEFWGHPDDLYNVAGYTGWSNYAGWVEDGFISRGQFWLDNSLGAVLDSFKVKLVAYNTADNTWFDLQEVDFSLTPNIFVSGIQQLNLNTTQGFQLPTLNQFNQKELKIIGQIGSKTYYYYVLGQKIDWQDWISNPNADTIFYDPLEQNNGLNQNASNYNLQNGYEIRLLIESVVNGTNYSTLSASFETWNYDEDGNAPAGWSGSIKTFIDSAYTNDITPNILENQDTYVEAEFNKDASNTCIQDNLWGILRIEPENNTSHQAIHELSSIYGAITNSPLQSFLPSGLLEMVITPTNVKLRGKIDHTKLMNTRQKLSARLGCHCTFLPPPIGRIPTVNNIGGASGIFTLTLELQEGDDTTGLVSGDLVTFVIRDKATNNIIETLTGIIGNDITTFVTSLGTQANSFKAFASGLVVDTGSLIFAKKDWAIQNNFTSNDLQNNSIELRIEVLVTDISTGLSSVNLDNFNYITYISDVVFRATISALQVNPLRVLAPTNFGTLVVISDQFAYNSTDAIYLTGNNANEVGPNLLQGIHPIITTQISLPGTNAKVSMSRITTNGYRAFNSRYAGNLTGSVNALYLFTNTVLKTININTININSIFARAGTYAGETITTQVVNIYAGGNIAGPTTLAQDQIVAGGTLKQTNTYTTTPPNTAYTYSMVDNTEYGLYYFESICNFISGRKINNAVPIILTRY